MSRNIDNPIIGLPVVVGTSAAEIQEAIAHAKELLGQPQYGPSPIHESMENYASTGTTTTTKGPASITLADLQKIDAEFRELLRNPPAPKPLSKADELGLKLCGKLLLADPLKRTIVPSGDEWIGVNLLERDDELPKRK
jgi:hypothetical protein